MSGRRGSDGKRLRMSPSDAEGSPKRSRSSRRRSPSPYSPSSYLSPSLSPSPYRSPSPSPCRSWSRRLPSNEDGDDDDVDDRSRTRGSDEVDGHARAVWKPHADRELGEHGRGGEFSVQIDDYDRLFTCRSCHRTLSAPVYQCPFAHVTCSRCHDEIGDNRCNCCGAANGYGRNCVVEEFLARIRFSCRNKEYGCSVFLPHNEMPAHEQTCRYEPSFCPIPHCGFAGRTHELGAHLRDRHHWDTIRFHYEESFQAPAHTSTVFRSVTDGELFFLDSFSEGRGTALSMICIRPENSHEQEFAYELRTPAGNSRRRPRLQIESTVRNTSMRHGMGEKEKVFLLVPNELPGSEDGYVDVRISKVGHRATP